MITVNVARDFSPFLTGRYKTPGLRSSGEEFREHFLVPHLKKGEKIRIEFDGVRGYGSSFLEEAFGGAVRETALPSEHVLSLIEIISEDLSLVQEIEEYIRGQVTRAD